MMVKKEILLALAMVLLGIGVIFAFGSFSPNASSPGTGGINTGTSGQTQVPANGETKTVQMSVQNGQYTPAEIRVKAGTKVRIEADPRTFVGCMSNLLIDGYNVQKRISTGDNVVEFVADKPGTFGMHCGMGMGNGMLVVEDATGSVPAITQVNNAPKDKISCGMGGGCGCGR